MKIQLRTEAHERGRGREREGEEEGEGEGGRGRGRGRGKRRLQSAIVFNKSCHVRSNDNNFSDEGS